MHSKEIKRIALRCERADDVSFAQYGKLVRRPDDAVATLASGAVESWSLPFESGSKPQIMFNRYHDKGRTFSVMEKHLEVTQCFFPLGGTPYIMVVGAETNRDGTIGPDDVKAFYVEGHHGVMLWRDVWHSLARFPVGAEYIDLAFITDCDTQTEIEGHLAGGPKPLKTLFVDFEKTHHMQFVVEDL